MKKTRREFLSEAGKAGAFIGLSEGFSELLRGEWRVSLRSVAE